MPILGALFSTFFGAIFTFLSGYIAKKTAMAVAYITTYGALTAALAAVAVTCVGYVTVTLPTFPGWAAMGFLMGLYAVAADSAFYLATCAIAVETAVYVYRWNVNNLTLLSRA